MVVIGHQRPGQALCIEPDKIAAEASEEFPFVADLVKYKAPLETAPNDVITPSRYMQPTCPWHPYKLVQNQPQPQATLSY